MISLLEKSRETERVNEWKCHFKKAYAQLYMKNEKTFTIVLSCQLYWGYGKLGSCQKRKNLTTICCCIFLKKIYCCPPFKKRWSVKGKKLVVADLPQIFKFPSHFLPVSTWVKPRTKDRPVQLSEFTIQNTLVETNYFRSSLIHLHIFCIRSLSIFTIFGQREM